MSLGLCCNYLDNNDTNLIPSRSLKLGRFLDGAYSDYKITSTYLNNLLTLHNQLDKVVDEGIRVYRMSSSMFPLWDKVPRHLWDNDLVRAMLAKIGEKVKLNLLRLTTHPPQFVSLSSENPDVVDNSIRELQFHGWIFDRMGLKRTPHYAINVHGGKAGREEELVAAIERLNPAARKRLTLENCEFAYSVCDLLDVTICTGVPIVFDIHHHRFNDGGYSVEKACRVARDSWPTNVRPLCHISNSKPELPSDASPAKLRAHSDFIYECPEWFRTLNNEGLIDLDVEAKKKNHAIYRMVDDMGFSLAS